MNVNFKEVSDFFFAGHASPYVFFIENKYCIAFNNIKMREVRIKPPESST